MKVMSMLTTLLLGVLVGVSVHISVGYAGTRETRNLTHSIYLVIKVPRQTPPADKIFITGNQSQLCNWQPRCLALRQIGPLTYATQLDFPNEVGAFSFKVTRGSWQSEATDGWGRSYDDYNVSLGNTSQIVLNVINWKDFPALSTTGEIIQYRNIYSDELGNARDISVWLPPHYHQSAERYPVIYMHDGQNLFDPRTSSGHVDWGIDETMTQLIESRAVRPAIVVGLNSTANRDDEYDYTKRGSAYADFLIRKIKPMIDRTYRSLPDRRHTFTLGSSMGGGISFSFLWAHPEVFSAAAAVSMHVEPAIPAVFETIKRYAKPSLPIRLYFDRGSLGYDADYQRYHDDFFRILTGMGYSRSDLLYMAFPYADHTEADWARRVDVALKFLLNAP